MDLSCHSLGLLGSISMGSAESTLNSQTADDEITTISVRSESLDPLVERLKSLKTTTPILKTLPDENSLTDILVRKPSSSPASVNPKVLMELFSTYREWQEAKAEKISKKQVHSEDNESHVFRCIKYIHNFSLDKAQMRLDLLREEMENKIEVADALAVKLLQRFNHSVSAMKIASHHLSGVHALQVELGELKGRLTEVISNCDALCKRISVEGPESLKPTVKPFFITSAKLETSSSESLQRML